MLSSVTAPRSPERGSGPILIYLQPGNASTKCITNEQALPGYQRSERLSVSFSTCSNHAASSVKTIFSSHLALVAAGGSCLGERCAEICTPFCGMLHPWCINKVPAGTGADIHFLYRTNNLQRRVPAHGWDMSQSLLPPTAVPPPAPSIGCCGLRAKGAEMQPLTGSVRVASARILSNPSQLLVLSLFQSELSSW